MRRRTPLRSSGQTGFPPSVRQHIASHQPPCVGRLAQMVAGLPETFCSGGTELDHIRASHGMGMKSLSIATNGARLCHEHHDAKTRDGRTWRPALLVVIARLHGECAACQRESIEVYGVPLEGVA